MGDTDSNVEPGPVVVREPKPEKPVSKTRISQRCAVETGVTERVAHGVLWRNWPVSNTPREKVWRWALEKRLFAPRDLALRPARVRAKKPKSPELVVKDLVRTIEADVEVIARAERELAAGAEFETILAEHAAREDS